MFNRKKLQELEARIELLEEDNKIFYPKKSNYFESIDSLKVKTVVTSLLNKLGFEIEHNKESIKLIKKGKV